jgi:signal peptidase I
VQSLAASFVGVMLVREFAILPVYVPTGSMEPAIFGVRPPHGPDQLLVDRSAYLVRDPRRWEIAVFEFPLQRDTNFVKRIVGLPGERVEIRDGNAWINDAPAPRSDGTQDSMWIEAFPRSAPRARPRDVASSFRADGIAGGWSRVPDGCRGTSKGERPSWFVSTSSFDGGESRIRYPELRISATATVAAAGGTAWLRVTSRGTEIVAAFRADGTVELRVGGEAPVSGRSSVAPGRAVSLSLSVADGAVRAVADGVVVARASAPMSGARGHGCALGVSGGEVTFTGVRVDRDVYYFTEGTAREWKVPPGHYFVLGDNSGQSQDSRLWRVTEFQGSGDRGTLRVAKDLLNEAGGRQQNILSSGGETRFTDVSGVPRTLRPGDILRRTDDVPFSFVPRDHMLGRAALLYWPWSPTDGGFRPRIVR